MLFDEDKQLCEYLIFKMREIKNNNIEWHDVRIEQEQLKKILLQHKSDEVDVVVIDTTEIITSLMGNDKYILPTGLTSDNLPKNQPLKFEVSDDIIVISYPRMFYDKTNKFPIVKSGIIASAYGMNFNSQPLFQIDAQLFPGSSGGLVLSKPKEIAVIDGKVMKAESKQYVFLGIYSGEYLYQENVNGQVVSKSYGLGNVWYSELIEDIINSNKKSP